MARHRASVKHNRGDSKACQTTISLLQDIQERKGYLPKKDMASLSEKLCMPSVDIYGVATFYSQFKTNKPGKYRIYVCRGTACHVKNSISILEYLENMLGIKPGQTTKDGKFTLECVNCIGACAKAPAMMINGKVYGDLTKEKVRKTISGLK